MAEPNAEYVMHTQKPRFIAKYTPGGPMSDFEIMDEIDNIAEFMNNDPIKVAALMRRLGDWFMAYCKWEEENYVDDDDE